jgi:predicted outer membrane protein
MIEIQKYCCFDGQEASKVERHFVEKLKATLNSNIPSRTQKEYRQDNKAKTQEFQKEYRQDYYQESKVEILEVQQKKLKTFCNICKCDKKQNVMSHHERSKNMLKIQILIKMVFNN